MMVSLDFTEESSIPMNGIANEIGNDFAIIEWNYDIGSTEPLYYLVKLQSPDGAEITRVVEFSAENSQYVLRIDNLVSNTEYDVHVTSVSEFGNSSALNFTIRTNNRKSLLIKVSLYSIISAQLYDNEIIFLVL